MSEEWNKKKEIPIEFDFFLLTGSRISGHSWNDQLWSVDCFEQKTIKTPQMKEKTFTFPITILKNLDRGPLPERAICCKRELLRPFIWMIHLYVGQTSDNQIPAPQITLWSYYLPWSPHPASCLWASVTQLALGSSVFGAPRHEILLLLICPLYRGCLNKEPR